MKTLTKFGFSSPQYVFPESSQISYLDNFTQLVTRATRMPGAHGGFDELGYGRTLHEIGSISAEFWLKDLTVSEMSAALDDFLQMTDWGKQILYMQPSDSGLDERMCFARVDDISYNQNVKNVPHKQLKIKVVFQVAEPYWLTAGTENLWDGSHSWNGAINWGGTGLTSITGSGSVTVTNSGNAYTLGRFVAKITGATPCTELVVSRTVSGGATDTLVYSGSLVQNDVLEIDSRQQMITLNGVEVLENLDFNNPDWLTVLPGSNTYAVACDDSSTALDCTVRYLERYT